MRREPPALFKRRHFEAEICPVRPLVPAVSVELSTIGGDLGRTELERRSRNDLALGTTVSAGTESTLPPGTTEQQPVVGRRRDVLQGSGQVDVSISGSGFHRCDDRLSPEREAGRGKAFSSESRALAGHPRPRVINVNPNPARRRYRN